jgi:uncharacterized membrane protein
MDKLLSDLRCTEEMERRTTNVAIETELTVSKLKEELMQVQSQLEYVSKSKDDLKQANRVVLEEKNILEREINALREHIKYQAYQRN